MISLDYSRVEVAADFVARSEARWQSHAFGGERWDHHTLFDHSWCSGIPPRMGRNEADAVRSAFFMNNLG